MSVVISGAVQLLFVTRVQNGLLRRPIQKLHKLELGANVDNDTLLTMLMM